jgi:hypothetical protein
VLARNYIVYRGNKTRDFNLKLQMKIEKGGGGGIQYRSVTAIPWTRPQPAGQPPYDLRFMMTGPQADFWFPVSAPAASYTGQWYSENTMQGILAYRGQVTEALPGQTNRLVANIGDKQALGGYVNVNEWNDYSRFRGSTSCYPPTNHPAHRILGHAGRSTANAKAMTVIFSLFSRRVKEVMRHVGKTSAIHLSARDLTAG